jgi:hypothetical protein
METKIENTVTCDGFPEIGKGHAPITFEGAFRALCPLCAALEGIKEAEAQGESAVDFNQAAHDKHIGRLEDRLGAAREKLEALANDAAELVDAAKTLRDALAKGDPQYSMNAEEGAALERLGAAITKIEKGGK